MKFVKCKWGHFNLKWPHRFGLADAELCATAAVDPDAAVVDAPGLALNARRAADLPVETDIAASTNVTPVSAAVVGRASDHDRWRGAGRGAESAAATAAAANEEVRAASAIDPEAPPVDTPCLALNTGRAADLPGKANVRPILATVVSAAIVGGAVDGLLRSSSSSLTEGKVGPATTIDPEAATIDTPGLPLDAGRAADLADEPDIAAGTDVAPVSSAIIGRAGYAA